MSYVIKIKRSVTSHTPMFYKQNYYLVTILIYIDKKVL